LDEWFKFDEQVDLEVHLGQSVGIFSGEKAEVYKIRLSANASRWLKEDPWHTDQVLEASSDGASILSVPAHHPMEIIPRVLTLGEDAEIIGPAHARKKMKELTSAIQAKYA
jgi:predicted DNA-binding transcriptional regulator YafY